MAVEIDLRRSPATRRMLFGRAPVAVGASASALVAACGRTGGNAGSSTTAAPVTLWWWNEQDMQKETEDEVVREWPQRYAHITLEPTKIPYAELTKKMLASMAGGDAPDVSYTHQDWTATFAQKQVLRPIDEIVGKDRDIKLNEYYPAAVEYQRWRGKLYGLTWLLEGSSLFYNRTLLEKAGLVDPRELEKRGQWTLDRFSDYLVRLSGGDGAQRTWGWNQGLTGKMSGWVDSVWAFGGEAFSPDGLKLTLHMPKSVEAIEWRVSHYRRRLTTAGDPDARGVDMNSSRLGFLRANRLHTFFLDPQGRWGHVLLPTGKDGQRWHRAGCSGHGIVSLTKKEAPAWELVKFLSLRGNRIAMVKNVANPLWPAVAESKEYTASMRPWEEAQNFIQLGKLIKVMVPPPGLAADSTIHGWQGYTAISQAIERVLRGEVTVKDAMEQAARECDLIVANAMR